LQPLGSDALLARFEIILKKVSMLLYLVQHGEAKKEEEDPQRGLTDKGRKDVQTIAASARKMNVQPDRIFHSAKLRAQQTAALLVE
jgi:phosphohistidine phosphatase